jgi:hypothetical protein
MTKTRRLKSTVKSTGLVYAEGIYWDLFDDKIYHLQKKSWAINKSVYNDDFKNYVIGVDNNLIYFKE